MKEMVNFLVKIMFDPDNSSFVYGSFFLPEDRIRISFFSLIGSGSYHDRIEVQYSMSLESGSKNISVDLMGPNNSINPLGPDDFIELLLLFIL